MSKTQVDMPKVTQMLDAGWTVTVFRGGMGSYEVRALHRSKTIMASAVARLSKQISPELLKIESARFWLLDGDWLMTDDFTPEQALTRMAYKVHGEII